MLVSIILLFVAIVASLLIIAGQSGLLSGKTPTNLGVNRARLEAVRLAFSANK